MPNGLKVITADGVTASTTAAFSGILLIVLFYYNLSSKYIIKFCR